MAKGFPVNSYTVKILGRAVSAGNILWLTHSGSGIQFNTVAKAVAITLAGDETAVPDEQVKGEESRARYAVLLDGKVIASGLMKGREQRIIVFGEKFVRQAKVSVIKLSESRRSFLGIKNIITDDGSFVTPEVRQDLSIEFIGDSITCGYGVETKSADEPFSTLTENVCKSYAWLCAKQLNADASFVCYSSYGVVSGWTESGAKDEVRILPKVYEQVAFCDNSKILKGKPWNFNAANSDIVVINLGTNDFSYTQDQSSLTHEFYEAYLGFIGSVREKNPNAHIVCCLGIMQEGDSLFDEVVNAVNFYMKDSKDRKIYTYHFNPVPESEGAAIGNHPSALTHARCAGELASFIKTQVLKIS